MLERENKIKEFGQIETSKKSSIFQRFLGHLLLQHVSESLKPGINPDKKVQQGVDHDERK